MLRAVELGYPASESGGAFADRLEALRARRSTDRGLSYADRLAALDGLGRLLIERRSSLPAALAAGGAAFLAGFLQASHLESLVRREIPDSAMLDRFTPVGDRRSMKLVPRGVVCQWIAGNVPLLAMFSWALSALAGNRNVLRLSSRQEDLISPLLRELASVSDSGRQLADETLICSFERDHREAHEQMSRAADVRIAWGGAEAVEAVRSLPCRWECDDIVMGPRVSLAVIDPATASGNLVARLATDVVVFDQSACSSPQVIFVKGRAGDEGVVKFAREFSEKMAEQSRRFQRHALDFGETYRIQLDRTRILFEGGALERDAQTRWTVAVVDRPNEAVRCANCFVQIVPFIDFDEVLREIPENVQTVVTSLEARDLAQFTEQAANLGVCRFPAPGTGNHFDDPWDGVPLVSRLTRWVTRSDPAD